MPTIGWFESCPVWPLSPACCEPACETVDGRTGNPRRRGGCDRLLLASNGEQMADLYEDYLAGNVDRDQVFRDLRAYIDRFADDSWKRNRQVASEFGLPLVAYEAGQHLMPRHAAAAERRGFVELLASLQRDPRMGELYDHLTAEWQALGGSTIVFFNNLDSWDKDGFWGLRDRLLRDRLGQIRRGPAAPRGVPRRLRRGDRSLAGRLQRRRACWTPTTWTCCRPPCDPAPPIRSTISIRMDELSAE